MIDLKNIIIFILIGIFIYIVYEFFYNNIPKMIEPFNVNVNWKTAGLEQLNKQVEILRKKQTQTQNEISKLQSSLINCSSD